jgi:hypothetical protein
MPKAVQIEAAEISQSSVKALQSGFGFFHIHFAGAPMKKLRLLTFIPAAASLLMLCNADAQAENRPAAAAAPVHGTYKDWRVIGISHRLDKNTLRAILGNDVAVTAARSGNSAPWPDGTILAKLAWQEKPHPNWPKAVIPGEFAGADAMVKDSKKYAATGGWGFGHWEGNTLVMHDQEKSAVCFACHSPMKDRDYVYTFPILQ